MGQDFKVRRRFIIAAVGLLIAADFGLAFYSWQLASAPRTPQQELDSRRLRLKVLRADIDRAQGIRDRIPAVQKECDQFEQSLLPATTGYSTVTADLGAIARKAGLQILTASFKGKEIANRNMAEVAIDATVSGPYGSVVRFVNGLQRSSNLYVLDGLALAADSQSQSPSGPLRVSLHLRTFFRTGA